MKANRLSGLVVAFAGLLLFLFVIPAHTETVDYGWMRPQTIPNACAVALMAFGALQAAFPAGATALVPREMLRVALFAAVAVLALWAMSVFGFRLAAPVFALTVMLLVGERRPGWLVAGAVGVPATIWLVAVPLLDRTLP